MAKRIDFDFLVAGIIQQEGLAALRPVVEKELLHYDILFCLSEAGLLKRLTFQGGTSLRLCLQLENPQLWQKLRLNDYDMLYFFFEEPLQNFIKMGETLRKKPSASQEFINAIKNY